MTAQSPGLVRFSIDMADLQQTIAEVTDQVPFRDSEGSRTTVAVQLADGRVVDISDLTGEDFEVLTDASGAESIQVRGFAIRVYPDMAAHREVSGFTQHGGCLADLDALASLLGIAVEDS